MADTNLIAKNTLYLYSRMLFVMAVAIFTSRVILDKLGADDYGLYNAVASVVGMIVFLNQTLSSSTSRFLTYELGNGDEDRQRKTFSTAFFAHLILAGLMVLVMETVGLWYLTHKFVIPEGREQTTMIVFQLSILSTAVSVLSVPYSATIIAHENMGVYAWIGIIEVVAKLLIAYLLSISPIDKLVFYSILLSIVLFIVVGIYFFICLFKYKETKLQLKLDKGIFHKMLGFSGWTAVANLSNTAIVQGAVVLMNLFFSPAIIAAKAIADQVTMAIMGFVNNFRTAMNPQIIKTYAAEQYQESQSLAYKSMVLSFYLLLMLGLPFIFTIKTILNLWLVEVPPLTLQFTQLAIIIQLFNVLPTSTYVSFVASGKVKSNALCAIIGGFSYFILLFVVFKVGGDVLWVQYLGLISVFIWILLLRPYLLHKELNYNLRILFENYWLCLRVFVPSVSFSYILFRLCGNSLWEQCVLFVGTFLLTICCVFIFMERSMRQSLIALIVKYYKRVKR